MPDDLIGTPAGTNNGASPDNLADVAAKLSGRMAPVGTGTGECARNAPPRWHHHTTTAASLPWMSMAMLLAVVPALRAVLIPEGFLHGVQLAVHERDAAIHSLARLP